MNYIVFDLEWNQCPLGKEGQDSDLPFEIIEIGAIKLNAAFNEIDRFHAIIKPVLYPNIHSHTQKIIQLTSDELETGISFSLAAHNFLEWCQCTESYIFCTWGDMDLTELQRNMKYFHVAAQFPKPFFYYDVQKLFGLQFHDGKTRFSLEHAVDFLNLPKNIPFHSADADTYYTVEIMKKLDLESIKGYLSIDYYNNPKAKKEEIYMIYDTYSKFVSREFNTKEQLMADKAVTSTSCYLCHKNIKKKIRWFSYNHKLYYSLMYCDIHGWVKGKIRIKRTENHKFFAVKTIKITNEAEALLIRKKKEEIQAKRRLHRKQERKGI